MFFLPLTLYLWILLIKFAEYVGKTDDHGSIYAEKECFTDENIAGFLLKYFNEKVHKPHFKTAILAAIGSGSLTLKMKKVSYYIILWFYLILYVNTNLSKKVNYSDGKNSINLTFDMREYHYANNNHSSQHWFHLCTQLNINIFIYNITVHLAFIIKL